MPVTYRGRGRSSERTYLTIMDWTRRIMQLAAVFTIGLYAYILYGLFAGGVAQWNALGHDEHLRILANFQGAVTYLDIVLGILLITACILFYDEEAFGYTLIAGSVFFYFGVPFLFDQAMPGKIAEWTTNHNLAALAIMSQFRLAGIMLAVPGGILLVRDVILRLVDGSRRKREDFNAMQYGGAVKEEAPVGIVPIGMLAKCWQLPFCRDAIRRRCPIYHARSRCWKERVGCMCEENVIRHAMDAIINKEIISTDKPKEEAPFAPEPAGPLQAAPPSGLSVPASGAQKSEAAASGPRAQPDIIGFSIDMPADRRLEEAAPASSAPAAAATATATAQERTEEFAPPAIARAVPPKHVKIPYNRTLSDTVKRERCRNCVIYNEHQRLKYQFLAPIVVLGVPALAYVKIETITGLLNHILQAMDQLMARLSPEANATNAGVMSSITSTSVIAEYLIIGCLVVIATTMVLRGLEYAVFKLKI